MVLPPLSPSLSIPTGYRTLAELGRTLSLEGVPIRVAEDCADDVYAICALETDWPRLRSALVADGRLAIPNDGGTWTVHLDGVTRARENAQAAQYVEAARQGLSRAFVPLAERVRKAFLLPEDQEPDEEAEIKKNLPPGLRTFVSSSLGDQNYSFLAVLATLLATGAKPGEAWVRSVFDAPFAIEPSGDLRKNRAFSPELTKLPPGREREAGWLLCGKIVWDPLSLATGYRWSYWTPYMATQVDNLEGPRTDMLSPTGVALAPPTPSAAEKPVVRPEWQVTAPMPPRPTRVSEAALRWAEATKTDLIAYVPPMGDLALPASPEASLQGIVDGLNAGRVDRSAREREAFEWSGLTGDRLEARTSPFLPPPARRATILKSGDFAVVRSEVGFLDRLCADKPPVPAAWENARLKGEPVAVEGVLRWVAAMKPSRWKGGLFPTGYLDEGNPITLYPFAAMLASDAELFRRVLALPGGKSISLDIEKLPKGAALRSAMALCAPFMDAVSRLSLDPSSMPQYVCDSSVPMVVSFTHPKGRLEFHIVAKIQHGGAPNPLWRSWVRLPQ